VPRVAGVSGERQGRICIQPSGPLLLARLMMMSQDVFPANLPDP
jgi:hypothetical protein